MAITYQNFRGDTYYLHSRKTKKGNTTYHFSKKSEGADVEVIPEGYEIYENPNGKVALRKKQKPLIFDDEIEIIDNGMKKFCPIKDYKLDTKKDTVYIYTEFQKEKLGELLGSFFADKKEEMNRFKEYETVMRFRLVDKEDRIFEVERFCFIGSIDDWIMVDGSDDLRELVEENVQHIGEDSFYELF
ncbi:hypothetical protein GWK91_02170 [Virgibacillus sp. MSP4-1]|uniref:hypothetical protein n=1 Tax=Virgibacillus sp. MSP4-1 TaxID=2700081 RepID=UPI00039A4D50|nr:hypothetical protein [Virgibacillus sp. MSP4-1]QHS21822.1 hypothetical protein GWK91_02170 [Virgibacillus sp. MSP4-1]